MPKTNPRLPVHDSRIFTWSGKTGCIEASDLPRAAAFVGRVYDDAVDVGFHVKSHRTGRTMLFVEVEPAKNSEGEVVAFCFAGDDGIVVEVVND